VKNRTPNSDAARIRLDQVRPGGGSGLICAIEFEAKLKSAETLKLRMESFDSSTSLARRAASFSELAGDKLQSGIGIDVSLKNSQHDWAVGIAPRQITAVLAFVRTYRRGAVPRLSHGPVVRDAMWLVRSSRDDQTEIRLQRNYRGHKTRRTADRNQATQPFCFHRASGDTTRQHDPSGLHRVDER